MYISKRQKIYKDNEICIKNATNIDIEDEICIITFHLDKFKHSDWLKEIQQFPMFLL